VGLVGGDAGHVPVRRYLPVQLRTRHPPFRGPKRERDTPDSEHQLRAAPFDAVLNLRTTTLKKCEAVPRRARV